MVERSYGVLITRSRNSVSVAGTFDLFRRFFHQHLLGRFMELHHVRYFLVLCEEQHFSKAARRCEISQPSLTNAIKRLEQSIGGALFQRRPRAAPTQLALAIKPDLEQILISTELAHRKAKRLSFGSARRFGPQVPRSAF